jgi:hypothetical protein
MKVLGINLETKSFRIAVLEGSKVNPSLIEKEKVVFNSSLSIADLMKQHFKKLLIELALIEFL